MLLFISQTALRRERWYKVYRVSDDQLLEDMSDEMKVFQWHRDTFELPVGAKLLYREEVVKNQAFRFKKALALQFHLEVTKE